MGHPSLVILMCGWLAGLAPSLLNLGTVFVVWATPYATNSSGEFHSPGMWPDACHSLCQSMQRRSSTPVFSSTVRSLPSSRRSAAAKSCASTW